VGGSVEHDYMDRSAEVDLAELLEPPPTTLAGPRAVIARRVEFDERSIPKRAASAWGPAALAGLRRLIRPRGAYRQAVGDSAVVLLRDK
jgi:hypothetical protein